MIKPRNLFASSKGIFDLDFVLCSKAVLSFWASERFKPHNPLHLYTETSSTAFSEAYSWVSIYQIAVLTVDCDFITSYYIFIGMQLAVSLGL